MAEKAKYLDLHTAAAQDSYKIRISSINREIFRTRFMQLTRIEKSFYVATGVAALLLTFAVVFVSTQISQVQSSTNRMRFTMQSQSIELDQYQQALAGLTQVNKIGADASNSGMVRNDSSVIEVTK